MLEGPAENRRGRVKVLHPMVWKARTVSLVVSALRNVNTIEGSGDDYLVLCERSLTISPSCIDHLKIRFSHTNVDVIGIVHRHPHKAEKYRFLLCRKERSVRPNPFGIALGFV